MRGRAKQKRVESSSNFSFAKQLPVFFFFNLSHQLLYSIFNQFSISALPSDDMQNTIALLIINDNFLF